VHKLQTSHSCRLQEVTPEKQFFHPTTDITANDELPISHCNINTVNQTNNKKKTNNPLG